MRGGWWLEWQELDRLIRYAGVNHRTLGYAVRLLCCVLAEWGSALDFIVAVVAAARIVAWRGLANSATARFVPQPGMPAIATGTTRIEAQNDIAARRVPQLYIPGTRHDGAASALFHYEGHWQTAGATDWIVGSGSG